MASTIPLVPCWGKTATASTIPPEQWWANKAMASTILLVPCWDKTAMACRVRVEVVFTIQMLARQVRMEVASTINLEHRINFLAHSKDHICVGMLLVTVKTDHRCKLSNVVKNWVLLVLVSHVVHLHDALFGVTEVW